MGELILHLGPPKTATTALQNYWLQLTVPGFEYLGINLPGENRSVAGRLHKYVSLNITDEVLENEFYQIIQKSLNRNNYVLISEESFVLEGFQSYEQKLKRLFKIIGRFKPTVIYCIRNVDETYFSYYVEFYKLLPNKHQRNFGLFQESKHVDCYRYKKMHQLFNQIGYVKLNFFFFEDLVSGKLKLSEMFGVQDNDYSFTVSLTQKNVTLSKNKQLVVIERSWVKSVILRVSKLIPNNLRGLGIISFFNKRKAFSKSKSLQRMSVSNRIQEEFNQDLHFLKHNLNITKKGVK